MNFRIDQASIEPLNNGSIEAWVPRSLISEGEDIRGIYVTKEGLIPLQISWLDGKVNSIKRISKGLELPSKVLLPRFVEPHSHIDKAFTWDKFPNLLGRYDNALKMNLDEYKLRDVKSLGYRSEKALSMALRNGIRSIRSHIDSFGLKSREHWCFLNELRLKWQSLVHIQYVALVPLDYWETSEGKELASYVSAQGDLLGGVITPPFEDRKCFESLVTLIKLANQLGCGIDLHIDESQEFPAAGLKVLVEVLDRVSSSISITCSHSSSMGLLPYKELNVLAKRLAFHKINVVALPLTNSWLLGRAGRATLPLRPLAPIYQLQKAGVVVAIGADNVNDSWFPLGCFDPIKLMAFSMPIAHLSPWERLGLSPFTTSASSILELEWDGMINNGSPANWVILEATSWVEILSSTTKKQLVINGRQVDDSIATNER